MAGEIKTKRGRPLEENKKVHVPRIVVYPETVEKMHEIALLSGRSLSSIYQDALDLYVVKYERKKNIISL
jgi:hypothetical protein